MWPNYRYLCFVLLAGFALVAWLVTTHPANAVDRTLAALAQGIESPGVTRIMEALTTIGSSRYVAMISVGVMGYLFFIQKRRFEPLFLLAVLAGSVGWNQLLKEVFHRARPDVHRLIVETGFSFPSGHTMSACALYGAIVFLFWRHGATRLRRGLLLAFGALMIAGIGFSRIYLGVHYPSDVLGALLAGGLWLSGAIWLYQWGMERRRQSGLVRR
jgi:undecaprenyl-diphosphatase